MIDDLIIWYEALSKLQNAINKSYISFKLMIYTNYISLCYYDFELVELSDFETDTVITSEMIYNLAIEKLKALDELINTHINKL